MASYLIIINVFFAALVVAGITGSLLWAITTQRRDWPAGSRPAANQADGVAVPLHVASVPLLGEKLATA